MDQKIILASGSPQRKALLKSLGVPFKVKRSQAEEAHKITSNCANLVKKNALLKAQDVAGRVREGIVIGADTVVYTGNKQIIGKPKNDKDARRILRILFSAPQWVYTGVAVVDARTGIQAISYEKTKVHMYPLSDQEINNYHKKMAPYDKAGGFDIEGYGSLFIKRIEGCYTNVIGLPMAKLAIMLKEFNINLM
jgi:septum formation protein